MIAILKKLLALPLVRHIIAGLAIFLILSSIYKGEIRRNKEQITSLTTIVGEMAKEPKYSIENRIDAGKSKDSHITLIPDNDLNVINPEPKPEVKAKRKGLFGWLKKKD